jgi:FSR family fosmidomycin resistance protein-like MFS transporter
MAAQSLVSDFTDPPLSAPQQTRVIIVVAIVHALSHMMHLVIPPIFPLLMAEFSLSYSQVGLLMTTFFVVSGVVQAASGFAVDRFGPFPVLVVSILLFVFSTIVLASAHSYPMLLLGCAIAGAGNAPFHPVDYCILNARIEGKRLPRSYAIHGVAGSLGWAAAPLLLVSVSAVAGWRVGLLSAGLVCLVIMILVWWARSELSVSPVRQPGGNASNASADVSQSTLGFMRLPGLWISFVYFLGTAFAIGGVQSFGAESAGQLHDLPAGQVALLVSVYMVGSAVGSLAGGWSMGDSQHAERIVSLSLAAALVVALTIGYLPMPIWVSTALFGVMGFAAGIGTPARDLLVKRAAPPGATGRIYGIIYAGLDVGVAAAPALFGVVMDARWPSGVWVGVALAYVLMIVCANLLSRQSVERLKAAA